jgi:hypothetical protein
VLAADGGGREERGLEQEDEGGGGLRTCMEDCFWPMVVLGLVTVPTASR